MKQQITGKNLAIVSISLFFLAIILCGSAAGGSLWYNDIAIKGYDPVAYFKDGKPVQGKESFSFKWHDLTWHFKNKEDKDLFVKNPEKYAPQYDGYCSWAMTSGEKAPTNPEVWKIVNGKLYLNCSRASFARWSEDIPGNIKKADKNWEKMKKDR
jgi:YHS domain-containing protein